MNGLFNTDFVNECLKGYYPFKMFNELYKLGESVVAESDCGDIYVCAAKSQDEAAVMLTHFSDDDETAPKTVSIVFNGADYSEAEIYLLDEENDMTLIEKRTDDTVNCIDLKMTLFSSYLIKVKLR